MQHRRARGWSIEAALTVALFLVVQAFFSGLAIGARAETFAPAGAVFCLGGSPSSSDPSAPATGGHLADCCTLGCPMVGGLSSPEPATLPVPGTFADSTPARQGEAHQPGRFELAPLRSRAPPEA